MTETRHLHLSNSSNIINTAISSPRVPKGGFFSLVFLVFLLFYLSCPLTFSFLHRSGLNPTRLVQACSQLFTGVPTGQVADVLGK